MGGWCYKLANIDSKVVAIVIGAVIITAVATGLFFSFGKDLSSLLTTSQSAHAASSGSCITDFSGKAPNGIDSQALEVCNFSDGANFHCLILPTTLYCR